MLAPLLRYLVVSKIVYFVIVVTNLKRFQIFDVGASSTLREQGKFAVVGQIFMIQHADWSIHSCGRSWTHGLRRTAVQYAILFL